MRAAKPLVFIVLLLGARATASAFELNVREPAFRLSVPGVPDIAVHEPAGSAERSASRVLEGRDDTYTVVVELSRQSGAVSPRLCASSCSARTRAD